MTEIESGSIHAMRDETFADLLSEINEKKAQSKYSTLLGVVFGLTSLALFAVSQELGFAGLAFTFLAWWFGSWLDSYRRVVVLFYELDDFQEKKYLDLTRAFDDLTNCAKKWHIEASGDIKDLNQWKRNAGASQLIKRSETTLEYSAPKVITSNLTPPLMKVGRQTMYFLPDVILFEEGSQFGAFKYGDVSLEVQSSRFIEDDIVPSDAIVVDRTWKHPNKKGGPDRRFSNNHEIPICLYEAMHFRSKSGLNELVEFSKRGVGANFSKAFVAMGRK